MSIGSLIQELLENFISILPIKAAAVVDSEGLIIGSKISAEIEELAVGGVTSQIQIVSDRMKKEFKMGGRFGTSVMDSEEGKLILVNIGNSGTLTIITEQTTDTDKILPYAFIIVEKLVRIIEDNILDIDVSLPDLASKDRAKYSFKMVILGDGGVGKTTLLKTFIEGPGRFQDDYKATIGVNLMNKEYHLFENITVNFNFYDLAGQDYFQKVRQTYLQGSAAAALVYDVTREETLDNIKKWFEETISILEKEKVECILIGNKIDLAGERKIDYEQGKNLAKELNVPFIETSAKNGDNVDRAFGSLAYNLVKRKW